MTSQSKAKSVDSRPLDLVVPAIAPPGGRAVRKVRLGDSLVHAGTAPAPTDSPRSGRGPSRPFAGPITSPLRDPVEPLSVLPLTTGGSAGALSAPRRSKG